MPPSSDEFIHMIKKVQTSIQAYVQYIAWDKNDIEDIFQTSLMNAYEKFPSFKKGSNFKAWILKFVTFTAYNINRRYEKQRTHEILDEAESIVAQSVASDLMDGVLSPEADYAVFLPHPDRVISEIRPELQQALLGLSVRKRSIFLLRMIGQLSYQEIAVLLQLPKTSVMVEIFRARKYLRKVLRQKNFGVKKPDREAENDVL